MGNVRTTWIRSKAPGYVIERDGVHFATIVMKDWTDPDYVWFDMEVDSPMVVEVKEADANGNPTAVRPVMLDFTEE